MQPIDFSTPAPTGFRPGGLVNWGSSISQLAQSRSRAQAANAALQTERTQLLSQQKSKGINNPQSLVNLQAALHNRQITPQQFTQQFATASKGATGATTNPNNPSSPKESFLSAAGQAEPGAARTLLSGVKSMAQFTPQQAVSVAHTVLPTHSSVPAQLLQQIQKMPVNQRSTALNPANKMILQNAKFNIDDLSDKNINNFIKQDTISAQKASSVTPKGTLATLLAGKQPIQSIPARVQGSEQALQTGIHIPIINKTVHAAGILGKILANAGVASQVGSGLAPIDSAVESGARIADKTSVALGKDEATNALINNQRVANASKSATLADRLGTPAVKEANTTRVPVISPTETPAARQAVGSVALDNANRTSIPVSGKSTEVTGKVTTPRDKEYLAKSNQLTSRYNKEMSAVQTTAGPYQKILQQHLDDKYSTLQEQLDSDYSKTSVAFNGKPKTIADLPEPKANKPLPSPTDTTPPPKSQGVNNTTAPVQGSAGDRSVVSSVDDKPTAEVAATPGVKVSGSAMKSEARAVQAGVVKDLGDKATYDTGSYTTEAAKAVDLAHNDPETAKAIAMGQKPGDNTIHEVAVRHAVEQKAISDGDSHTLLDLSKSTQHTATSESAQRLGAEGYNTSSASPVAKIIEINNTRKIAFAKRTGQSIDKAASSEIKAIRAATPKVNKETFASFVDSLKC